MRKGQSCVEVGILSSLRKLVLLDLGNHDEYMAFKGSIGSPLMSTLHICLGLRDCF